MSAGSENCAICVSDIPEAYEFFVGKYWRIRHSQETKILGYCIIEPFRHILDLSEAEPAELSEYGVLLSALMKTQRAILGSERIYTFSLAEAVPHYHLHVIPRSAEFPRSYKGRGIMSYPTSPAAAPVLVESFGQSFSRRLKTVLAESGRVSGICPGRS